MNDWSWIKIQQTFVFSFNFEFIPFSQHVIQMCLDVFRSVMIGVDQFISFFFYVVDACLVGFNFRDKRFVFLKLTRQVDGNLAKNKENIWKIPINF